MWVLCADPITIVIECRCPCENNVVSDHLHARTRRAAIARIFDVVARQIDGADEAARCAAGKSVFFVWEVLIRPKRDAGRGSVRRRG